MAAPNQTLVSLPDGITLEWRADLVSLDVNATNFARLVVSDASTGLYCLMKGRDVIFLHNWLSDHDFSIFACDRVATPNSNVVLCLALTRVQPNLVLTARVLDKADPSVVLYQRTVVDTPNADPTLTAAEFQALTGMRLVDLNPDAPCTPFYTSVGPALGVLQYTDGNQPRPKAIFDNLELRASEIPPLGIERAVRLSWPASSTISYAVQGAPTVNGPWLPVQDLTLPCIHKQTVPVSTPAQFFRLTQSP